ncbi:MAG: cysteine hydrolase [Planctomycetes bacterium]|nr:cysteine hydrolase [Planctomycetota bacterium]
MDVEQILQTKVQRIAQSHQVIPEKTALLVVDMQHGFLDPGASLEVPKGRDVVPNIASLIEGCREFNLRIAFTEFVYSTTIPCLRGDPFGWEHLPAEDGASTGFGSPSSNCLIGNEAGVGVESSATINELSPRADELVVQAHTYDKFYGTHLDLALRSWNVDRLIVTGVTTDVCVNSTILSAATRNYRVIAVTDGMATIHDHIHQSCLQIWQNKFARLATTAELLSEIRS